MRYTLKNCFMPCYGCVVSDNNYSEQINLAVSIIIIVAVVVVIVLYVLNLIQLKVKGLNSGR